MTIAVSAALLPMCTTSGGEQQDSDSEGDVDSDTDTDTAADTDSQAQIDSEDGTESGVGLTFSGTVKSCIGDCPYGECGGASDTNCSALYDSILLGSLRWKGVNRREECTPLWLAGIRIPGR